MQTVLSYIIVFFGSFTLAMVGLHGNFHPLISLVMVLVGFWFFFGILVQIALNILKYVFQGIKEWFVD